MALQLHPANRRKANALVWHLDGGAFDYYCYHCCYRSFADL